MKSEEDHDDEGGVEVEEEGVVKVESVRESEEQVVGSEEEEEEGCAAAAPPPPSRGSHTKPGEGDEEEHHHHQMCEECGFVGSKSRMKYHRRTAHHPGHQCPKCPLQFKKTVNLWAHYSAKHNSTNGGDHHQKNNTTTTSTSKRSIVCCATCGEMIKGGPKGLLQHEYDAHGEGEDHHLQCEHCSKFFKHKDTLSDHIRRVHEGKGFYCDLCPGGPGRRGDLQSAAKLWKHKVDFHGLADLPPPPGRTLIECEFCGEKMFRGLVAHIKKRHPEVDVEEVEVNNKDKDPAAGGIARRKKRYRPYQKDKVREGCSKCGKVMTKSSLRRHMKDVHGEGGTKAFPCPHCDRAFLLHARLTQHIRFAHERVMVDAALRSLDFIQFSSLGLQRKRQPLSIFCLQCDSELGDMSEARTHLAMEHASLYESILLAGKNSSASDHPPSTTTTHLHRLHLLLQCKSCPTKLPSVEQLRSHLESSHAGSSCVKCPSCSKVMLSSKELSFHTSKQCLRNGGNRYATKNNKAPDAYIPIQCPFCDKRVKKYSLRKHLDGIHGGAGGGEGGKVEVYPCPRCNKVYKFEILLKEHIRLIHEMRKVEADIMALDFLEFVSTDHVATTKTSRKRERFQAFCLQCDTALGGNLETRVHLAMKHVQVYRSIVGTAVVEPPPAHSTTLLLECKLCPERLESEELRAHVASTHPEKCWKCPSCLKVMLSSRELCFHFQYSHKNGGPQQQSQQQGGQGKGRQECTRKKENKKRSSSSRAEEEEEDSLEGSEEEESEKESTTEEEEESSSVDEAPPNSPTLRRSTRKRKIRRVRDQSSSSSSSSSSSDQEEDTSTNNNKPFKRRYIIPVPSSSSSAPALLIRAPPKKEAIELKDCRIHLMRLTGREISEYVQKSSII